MDIKVNQSIVPGSIAAIANRDGLTLAESFLNCEVLVVIDQSGSMGERDAPGGRSRYDAADGELQRLQKQHPGRVGVIEFSSAVKFCPGGLPSRDGGGTNMAAALNFARVSDGACKIVLISDGEPDRKNETLVAARRYRHPIHTVYIGPEGGAGRDFLNQLAAATGGRSFESTAPGLLGEGVSQLLLLKS